MLLFVPITGEEWRWGQRSFSDPFSDGHRARIRAGATLSPPQPSVRQPTTQSPRLSTGRRSPSRSPNRRNRRNMTTELAQPASPTSSPSVLPPTPSPPPSPSQASSPPRPPPGMPPLYEGTEWRTSYNPDDRSLTTIERRPSITALGFLVMIVMADMREGGRLPWLTHIQTEPDEETGEDIRTIRWVRSSDFLSQPPEVQEQSMSALQVIHIVWRMIQERMMTEPRAPRVPTDPRDVPCSSEDERGYPKQELKIHCTLQLRTNF
nr:PREDICTED: uncharacterized protein LOC109031700 [Bemisia tabaci]